MKQEERKKASKPLAGSYLNDEEKLLVQCTALSLLRYDVPWSPARSVAAATAAAALEKKIKSARDGRDLGRSFFLAAAAASPLK